MIGKIYKNLWITVIPHLKSKVHFKSAIMYEPLQQVYKGESIYIFRTRGKLKQKRLFWINEHSVKNTGSNEPVSLTWLRWFIEPLLIPANFNPQAPRFKPINPWGIHWYNIESSYYNVPANLNLYATIMHGGWCPLYFFSIVFPYF
jgi:hypothetical protein